MIRDYQVCSIVIDSKKKVKLAEDIIKLAKDKGFDVKSIFKLIKTNDGVNIFKHVNKSIAEEAKTDRLLLSEEQFLDKYSNIVQHNKKIVCRFDEQDTESVEKFKSLIGEVQILLNKELNLMNVFGSEEFKALSTSEEEVLTAYHEAYDALMNLYKVAHDNKLKVNPNTFKIITSKLDDTIKLLAAVI